MTTAVLKLANPTPQLLKAYGQAAIDQDYMPIQGSPDGHILITDQDDAFVAGVSIFPSRGRYVMFEDAVSRPGLSPRIAIAAGELIVEQIISYCNIHGKVPVCPVTVKSLMKLMQRAGFYAIPSWVMRRQPEPLPMDSFELKESSWEPKTAPPEPGVGGDSGGDLGQGVMEVPGPEEKLPRTKRKAKRRVD